MFLKADKDIGSEVTVEAEEDEARGMKSRRAMIAGILFSSQFLGKKIAPTSISVNARLL